ncbi:MAG: preprotein translocase subunit SecE [Eubacteriales bacterium]|jgi:preprotein translocase subunit SecE|nr:preprotein translocase subunit SecE [Eubacteriales bacterium]
MANEKNRAPEENRKNIEGTADKKGKKKGGLGTYFKEVSLEMKKVVWPTRKELGQYTVVVLVTCAFFALMYWGIDSGFLAILRNLLGISM